MIRLTLAIASLTYGHSSIACAQNPSENESRAAIVGYVSNIRSFTYFKVNYLLTQATAVTFDDALRLKFQSVKTSKGLHCCDGDYESIELFGSDNQSAESRGPSSKSAKKYRPVEEILSQKFLISPTGTLIFSKGVSTINLYKSGSDKGVVDALTPINMGFMGHRCQSGPDQLISNPSEIVTDFLGKQEIEGSASFGVRFLQPRYSYERTYFLDPSRGYLPAKFIGKYKDKEVTALLLNAKEYSGGRWFPHKTIVIYESKNGNDVKINATLIEVVGNDIDMRPSAVDISCQFPPNTSAFIVGSKGRISLKQEERITAHGLSEIFEKVEMSRTASIMDTGLTAQIPQRRWPLWTAIAGAMFALAGGGWLWLRKRRLATA